MAELVFKCAKCGKSLSISESAAGSSCTCPQCSMVLKVPEPEIRFRCPGCKAQLCAKRALGKEKVSCPNCERMFPVDVNLECIACGEQLRSDAVICVKCGTNQISGEKVATEYKAEQSGNLPSYLKNRFKSPVEEKKEYHFSPYIIFVIITLVGGFFAYKHFSKPKAIEIVKAESIDLGTTNVTVNIVSNEAPIVKNNANALIVVLNNFKARPSDSLLSAEILKYIQNISDSNSIDIAIGLKMVYSLSQIGIGNENIGVKCFESIKDKVSKTEFASYANFDKYFSPCQVCAGKKVKANICSICNGSKKCKSCAGLGFTTVEAKNSSFAGPQKSGNKFKAMGQSASKKDVKCSLCKGSGLCLGCKGEGNIAIECVACSGKGNQLDKNILHAAFLQVIVKTIDIINKEPNDIYLAKRIASSTGKDYVFDKDKINLFDALICFADKTNMVVSIDPEVIYKLAETQINVRDLNKFKSFLDFEDILLKNGLIVTQCPLSASGTNKVSLITTKPIWAYSVACVYIFKNKIREALSAITADAIDNSEYGIKCQKIKSNLNKEFTINEELRKLALKVNEAIPEYISAKKTAKQANNFQGLRGPSGGWGERRLGEQNDEVANQKSADAKEELARNKLDLIALTMNNFFDKTVSNNRVVWDNASEAYENKNYSECYYWLSSLINNYDLLVSLNNKMKEAGAFVDNGLAENLGDVPDDLKKMKDSIGEDILGSYFGINKLNKNGTSFKYNEEEIQLANESFQLDPGNLYARVHVGLTLLNKHIAGFSRLNSSYQMTENEFTSLVRDLNKKAKVGQLTALKTVTGKDIPINAVDPNKNVSVVGLAVTMGWKGISFPLSVKLLPKNVTVFKVDKKLASYWGFYQENYEVMLSDNSIEFGDYGKKDRSMYISAVEVYKWLCGNYSTNMINKKMVIDFQDLTCSKGGDSAGVTMAVSAFSSLFESPISQNLAMTGSVRSDGTVHAVGGIYEKVAGAASCDGVEIIVVPKENDNDLFLVPFDDLCKLVIIESGNISSYIKLATDPSYLNNDIINTQKAQALILLGRYEEAETILLDVAQNNQDIFTARRLLELLSHYRTDAV